MHDFIELIWIASSLLICLVYLIKIFIDFGVLKEEVKVRQYWDPFEVDLHFFDERTFAKLVCQTFL